MSNRRASICVVAAVIALSMFICIGQCLAYNPGDPEFRGFWVDAWGAGIQNQSQVDTLLGVVGNGSSKGQIREANCMVADCCSKN